MTNATSYTATRKIGQNRGKPRLWIEGKVLMDAGLEHGTRWDLIPQPWGISISINPEGKRKVSGKPDRPVIDIAGATLGTLGEQAEVTLMVYAKGGIDLMPAGDHGDKLEDLREIHAKAMGSEAEAFTDEEFGQIEDRIKELRDAA